MSVPSGQNLVAWRQEWILKSNSNWHRIWANFTPTAGESGSRAIFALFVDIFCVDSNLLHHRLDHEHVDELCRIFVFLSHVFNCLTGLSLVEIFHKSVDNSLYKTYIINFRSYQ